MKNAGTSIFSFSYDVFPPHFKKEIAISAVHVFDLTSASAFNFVQCKILSFGKELIYKNHLKIKKTTTEFLLNAIKKYLFEIK